MKEKMVENRERRKGSIVACAMVGDPKEATLEDGKEGGLEKRYTHWLLQMNQV